MLVSPALSQNFLIFICYGGAFVSGLVECIKLMKEYNDNHKDPQGNKCLWMICMRAETG